MNRYWQGRMEHLVQEEFLRSEKYVKQIQRAHRQAMVGIERDISYYLKRIAKTEGVSFQEAQKKLTRGEFDVFHMSLTDYIKNAKTALKEADFARLEVASSLHHISRLQAMGYEMEKHVAKLHKTYADTMEKAMKEAYENSFYKSQYAMQTMEGYRTIQKLAAKDIEIILNRPWTADGKTFSKRIWENQEKLIDNLQRELTHGAIRGESLEKITKSLAKRMEVSERAAKRLVHTENAWISNQAVMEAMKQSTADGYEILATLDHRTSDICREMDGKVFKMEDYEPGHTAPPFHVYCRSTIVAHYAEDDYSDEKRIAKDYKGKNYKVPSSMDYGEWYKTYVATDPKALAAEKAWKNRHSDRKQFERYNEMLYNRVPKTFAKFQDLKYNRVEEWRELKKDFGVMREIEKDDKIPDDRKVTAQMLYFEFKRQGFYVGGHFTRRFITRRFSNKGRKLYDFDDIIDILKSEPNYIDTRNGRFVRYYRKVGLVVDGEKFISLLTREEASKHWKKIK